MDPAEAADLDHRRELAREAVVIYLHHLAVSLVVDDESATEQDVGRAYLRLLDHHGWRQVLLMLEPLDLHLNG